MYENIKTPLAPAETHELNIFCQAYPHADTSTEETEIDSFVNKQYCE